MTLVYAGVVVLIAATLLWQARDPSIRRSAGFFAAAAVVLLVALDALGGPKPHWAEWRGGDLHVVAVEYDPGHAIYIWTRNEQPVAYRLPWSEELARQLQKGMREAEETGRDGVRLGKKGYAEYEAHPAPVRGRPAKVR